MWRRIKIWLWTLLAAAISGGANNILAALGINVANMMGFEVQQLTWGQVKILMLSGALVGAATYLAKSPLPSIGSGATNFWRRREVDRSIRERPPGID